MKKIFLLCKNFVIERKYIYCLKIFYIHPGFFYIKNICLIIQKLMRSMNFFYAMIFGSQIWSSIYYWNGVKFLHGLYSDFDAYVKD